MGKDTKIEWATDTFNPWRGCTKVSEACRNCYAETQAKRNPGVLGIWGDKGTRVVASEATWREPLKWDREAKAAGVRRRVFCASMADVFEDWQSEMCDSRGRKLYWDDYDDWHTEGAPSTPLVMQDVRRRMFGLAEVTKNLIYLLLTKRPENVRNMVPSSWLEAWPENVWIGTTVENQQAADERIPHLLRVPAKVRFLSCEPLLGPINLIPHRNANGAVVISQGINADWVIAGGESGPHARPTHPDWFRSLRDQCQAAGVPFFFKQWGCWSPGKPPTMSLPMSCDIDGQTMWKWSSKSDAGRMLDGREWNDVPE